MDFVVEQVYDADPDVVMRAYTDPALYAAIGAGARLGRPELLERRAVDGGEADDGGRHGRHADVVELQIRYRFTGDLSPAARAVLDPDRLTWVERSRHDMARGHVTFRLAPDHYADRLRASGECHVAAAPGGGTVRTVRGSVVVKALVVGGAVERAIVSGLRDHLADEAAAVERFLAEHG